MNPEFTTFIESLRNEKNSELIDTMVEGLSFALGNQLRSNDELREATDRIGETVTNLEDMFNTYGMVNELDFMQSLGGYIRQVIEQGQYSSEFVDALVNKLNLVRKRIAERYEDRINEPELHEMNRMFDDMYYNMRLAVSLM